MFKTVANCSNVHQAHSFQIALGAAGIESFIPDEISAGLTPHFFMTRAGVRLQVPEEGFEAAQQVLKEHRALPEEEPRNDA